MKIFIVSMLVLSAPNTLAHEDHATNMSAILHHFLAHQALLVTILFGALLILPLVIAKRLR